MNNNFEHSLIDLYGLSIGFIAFLIVFFYSHHLFCKNQLNTKKVINILFACLVGHFIGAFCYYWLSIRFGGSDSVTYFYHVYQCHGMLGYSFSIRTLQFLRTIFLGDSLLGGFLLFGSLGYLGSVYYFLAYKKLLSHLAGQYQTYYMDYKQIVVPAILILCWPSYFFWSAGLAKDSFTFLSVGMILYCSADGKKTVENAMLLLIGATLGFLVRPYFFIIFFIATSLYLVIGSKHGILIKTILTSVLLGSFELMTPYLQHFNSLSYFENYAVTQQNYMNIGATFPMPTHNPHLVLLFLPYMLIANIFLPLGIYARNFMGIISSIENFFLVYLVYFSIKNKFIWKKLKSKVPIVQFFLVYFFVGMSFLSIMSTNLGLAMRQKSFYVPALLICICLLYSYRRMLLIQHDKQVHQENNPEILSTATTMG